MPFDIWGDGSESDPFNFQPLNLGVEPEDLPQSVRNAIFSQVAPSPDQVAKAEEEQSSSGWGTIGTILSIPEWALFGQAIKGAVKGGIEGGVSGALKGFARGTPFAALGEALGFGDLSDETRFSDIRRALGQSDVEEGAANFLLNLVGEIALSPIELLAAPFGLTAKGSSAAARGVAKASIANAVRVGERAALVFKVPFAKGAFASTNLGFKSGATVAAQGLDAIGGFLRTNAVTAPFVKFLSDYAAAKDPEVAALGKKGAEAVDRARRETFNLTLMAFQGGVTPEGKRLVQSGKYGDLLTTLSEFGVSKIDDLGSYEDALKKLGQSDVTMREARRDAILAFQGKQGGAVRDLWVRAKQGDVDAIGTLYRRHADLPLSEDMLAAAGLKPRVGVELSWTQGTDTLAENLDPALRGLPTAEGSGTFKRSTIASEAPGGALEATNRARAGLQADYARLMDEIKAGTVDKKGLDSWLSVHKQQMIRLGQADILHGFLNESMEPFLGLYAPRLMSPEAAKLIEDHFAATLSKYNYAHPRKLRDMLAVEINAVAEDFGLRATGFSSLKKLKDTKPESVLSAIFDRPFLRQLYKVDPKAVEFFQILPVENLFTRASATAERMSFQALGKTFFADDSAAVLDVLDPERFAKEAADALVPGGERVAIVDTKGTIRGLDRATAMETALGPEVTAQYEIASHRIREDALARMTDVKGDAAAHLDELRTMRDLTEDAIPDKLAQRKGELLASTDMKRAVQNAKRAKDELATLREAKKAAPKDKALAARVKDAEGAYKWAKAVEGAQREAINDFLDDMAGALDDMVGKTKADIGTALERRRAGLNFVQEDKDARLDLVRRLREKGVSPRAFAQEIVLQKKYGDYGVQALDEAKTLPVPEGGTLFDRMAGRWDKSTKIKIVSREAWEAYKKLADDMARPDLLRGMNGAFGSMVRGLDTIRAAWSGHTVYNPLFLQTRVRNLVQSSVAASMGNLFTTRGQFEAASTLSTLRKAIEEGKDVTAELAGKTVAGTDVSMADALFHARRLGVIGAGGYAYEAGLTIEQAAALKGTATLKQYAKDVPSLLVPWRSVKDSPWLQQGLRLESTLDDHSRFAAYLGGIKNGMEPEQAASAVRKWLYDSSRSMSWTERTIFRRLIPFYSFQKYAIGQTADLFFTKPGVLGAFEKTRRNAYEAAGVDPKTIGTVLPRYIADGYGIPYRNTERGPEMGLFGSFFTVGEVAKIASAFDSFNAGENDISPSLRYIFTNMHPAIRAGVEWALNLDFYQNRKLEDFPGQTQELFGIAMPKEVVRLSQQLRFVNELNRLNLVNLNEAKVIIDAVDRDSGEAQSGFATRLLSSALSPLPLPRAKVVDVGREARYRNAQDERSFREAKGRVVRRAVGAEKVTSEADIAALQEVMAETAARIRRRDKATSKYADPNAEPVTVPRNPVERLLLGR